MRRAGERGVALVAVMVIMLLLMGIGAAIHTGVVADTQLRGAHGRATAGFYAAEAGINRGMGEYRDIFLAYNVPSGSDFNPHSFGLGPRTVNYQLASVPGNPTTVTVPAGKQFSGLHAIEYRYTANSTSQLTSGDTEASLGTEFDVDYIPLFQFLAFYSGDLEILPGQAMTLHGPIHTNGSLYLNASGSTLTVADLEPTIPTVHLSAAGDVIRRRKDDPSTCSGTVQIAKLVDQNHDGNLDLLTMGTCGVQSSAALSNWLGAIKSHQPVVSVPTPDVIARGSGTFWQKADLRIVLNVATPDAQGRYPIVVQDVNGNVDGAKNARLQQFMLDRRGRVFYNDVPVAGHDNATACGNVDSYCNMLNYAPAFGAASDVYACAGTDLGLYGACGGVTIGNQALSTGGVTARRGGFYSNREHAWVLMLNVNMHDLLDWNTLQAPADRLFDPADTTDGGVVVFLSVAGAGSNGIPSPRYGVRVFGSPSLGFPIAADPTGLTLASDQGFYVEGDYNVGTAPQPKQPAAILGDTINVLSKAWSGSGGCQNDCQSRQPLAARNGAATTINAAFIGGVDVTSLGNYNGGLENYPRFHESWTNLALVYRGSFVSLGTPRHNNGAWCGTGAGCNIYNPPIRAWDYDTSFQTVENLPPLTPRFVSVQQILFTENFR
jgi:hypothetical protein